MSSVVCRVGILVSTSGSYGAVGRSMRHAVSLAASELAADGVVLDLVCADPGGDNARYFSAAQAMLQAGVRHVVGCYTSSSRKDILPLFERHGAVLWYPAHYEGFESSDNVVYTGTPPNHHLYPLIDFMMAGAGQTAYCIGSDYIWAWESNRVFRDEFSRRGGRVLGESYVSIDDIDMDAIIDRILALQPAFILNNLIGTSSYHFFRAFRAACQARGIVQPQRFPIVSCNLSEADLMEIGPQACDGHFSSSVYFASVDTPENRDFVRMYRQACPDDSLPTVEAEATYIALHMLGAALRDALPDDVMGVRRAALQCRMRAPQGEVYLDPLTFHAYLTPRMGLSTAAGGFEVVAQAPGPVRPDPYLVDSESAMMLLAADQGVG